ncbi:MAG: hypothetical protein IJB41_09155 [Clostridia bacterium]|nr:hypothetical protein [Clostridia bacterium]
MDYAAWNSALLERLSLYLNGHERDIDAASARDLMRACRMNETEAFSMLLAAMLGLETDLYPEHRQAFEAYFPYMVRLLDPALYRADPYYAAVRIPSRKQGRWELCTQTYAPCEAFVCGDMQRMPDGRLIAPIGFFMEPFSYPCVKENGREWMLITPNEIETMRPAIDQANGKVLAFGLGLGYFAFMAARKPEVASVTVVERDANVIRLFKEHILPQFPQIQKLRIVQADAFDYMQNCAPAERYDFIFTDLWHDAGDGLPLYRRMKALEPLSPASRFTYWIEPTLRAYL